MGDFSIDNYTLRKEGKNLQAKSFDVPDIRTIESLHLQDFLYRIARTTVYYPAHLFDKSALKSCGISTFLMFSKP
ncbi:hypothetical protein SINU_09090 [Sporolactobacillus inulinus CASD]|uniref:Uncharacterized protein n=1 Tax=Sporolactobacillus inulinus CASD TaxID=1069536 RepID=A0A0U1QN71_9BACL|nr:hypothetical protein SINU_09090 [Sporolactobacillus inulinus CASD]